MRRLSARPILLLSLFSAAGCDFGADPDATVRTDSAGIEVVRTTDDYRRLDWQFEPEFTIGANEGPGTFERVRPHTVEVSPDGDIFVLETTEPRIYIFDQNGRLRKSIASTPEADLGIPSALVLQDDGFAVYDVENTSLVRFSPEGEYLGTRDAPRQFLQGELDFDGVALVLTQRVTDPETGKPILSIVRVSPTDTTYVIAAEIAPELEVSFAACGVMMLTTPLFGEPPAWDAGHGFIAVAEAPLHGVRMYREGREVRRVRRRMPPEPSTNHYALLAAGDGQEVRLPNGEMCTIPPEDVALGSGWKDVIPSIGSITITPEGGLWLRRVDPGRNNPAVDVMDPSGEYIGTLPLGTPWPIAFLPGGRPLVMQDDSLGVTHLVAYRIDRTGGPTETQPAPPSPVQQPEQ